MPFWGRREGEQMCVHYVGESTGERSWGFVASQWLTIIMFALGQKPCDARYRHLSTTCGYYKMRITADCEVQCKVQFHLQLELIE